MPLGLARAPWTALEAGKGSAALDASEPKGREHGVGLRESIAVLVSESISLVVGTPLTEEMVAFTCGRCGQTWIARDASIARHGADVTYACSRDGSAFATVRGGEPGRRDGDLAGYVDLAIQRDGAWIGWSEVVERNGSN